MTTERNPDMWILVQVRNPRYRESITLLQFISGQPIPPCQGCKKSRDAHFNPLTDSQFSFPFSIPPIFQNSRMHSFPIPLIFKEWHSHSDYRSADFSKWPSHSPIFPSLNFPKMAFPLRLPFCLWREFRILIPITFLSEWEENSGMLRVRVMICNTVPCISGLMSKFESKMPN